MNKNILNIGGHIAVPMWMVAFIEKNVTAFKSCTPDGEWVDRTQTRTIVHTVTGQSFTAYYRSYEEVIAELNEWRGFE